MHKWTTHTKYTFHCETNLSKVYITKAVERELSMCAMTEDYVGAWEGKATKGVKVTWIAACGEPEGSFEVLHSFLRAYTENTCVMPIRERVEVFCTCA